MKTLTILHYFAHKKLNKKTEKTNRRTGSEIRKLQAFIDSDCTFGASQKNSWHRELLHSRTAGVERVTEPVSVCDLAIPGQCHASEPD